MSSIMRIILAVILSVLLLGCNSVEKFDMKDFPNEVYTPKYANGFRLLTTKDADATLLVIDKPWQGDKTEQRMLLIDPHNRFAMTKHPHLQRITSYPKRVICLSSSHIAMLDALGQSSTIVGVSGRQFIFNKTILAKGSKVGDVGYDGNFNIELLISLKPDLVLLYGINAKSELETQLNNFKIPYVYIGEYMESSPLGKAEWIVAIAEIMGHRQKGIEKFGDIEQRYLTLRDTVEQYITTTNKSRPSILLNTPYRDVWYLPAPNSYIVELIKDAGGEAFTAGKEGETTTPIGIEQAYTYAQHADFWLNVGGCKNMAELTNSNPLFASTRPIINHKVYNNIKRQRLSSGSDFWESGVVNPDIILEDLIKIMHPGLLPNETLHYYIQLK